MQYIKELPNGDRKRVSADEYATDVYTKADALVYLVRTNTVTIYHTNGMGHKTPFQNRYHYGGRGRAAARGNLIYCGA